ncbi:MAG: hypothetical protein AAFX87_29070 [Bacteroidota bacterium]
MGKSNVLKRIIEQRVNIAFSKEQYYHAYYRLRDLNIKKLRHRRMLFNVSTGIGIFILSGLLVHVMDSDGQAFLIISLVLSLTSVFLSIYIATLPEIKDPFEYLQRAEGLNVLYKQIKTLEAKVKDGCVEDDCELSEFLEEIDDKSKVLYNNPLPMENEDYEAAQKNIKNNNLTYTDEELQNT